MAGRAVFASDAGLTIFGASGEIQFIFNDLNSYFINIDLNKLGKQIVTFTRGDSTKVTLSINELIERSGKNKGADFFIDLNT